ncbi:protein G12-like [Agrilus planipennis]|uniref:Protein G12-like n=1 Tax=Agrilus planipennis TaxID=224129 RepID=A0A1W4X383_AGRPL|nr:protein G12-like [Agrilus planipennis]
MDKSLLVLAALVTSGFAASISSRSLDNDLREIYNLIPKQKYLEMAKRYLRDDPDFANAVAFLQGDEWNELIKSLLAQEEIQQLIQFLEESNLPVKKYMLRIKEKLDKADTSKADRKSKGTFKRFLKEAIPLFPYEDLVAAIKKKIASSPEFRQLYTKLSSNEAGLLVERVVRLPETSKLLAYIAELGLIVDLEGKPKLEDLKKEQD